MPDPSILVIGPAITPEDSVRSLEAIKQIALPNATKIVAASGKFETHKQAKSFNFEAGYPAQLPNLQTLAAWAGSDASTDARFRDGHELFCLRSIVAEHAGAGFAMLVRSAGWSGDGWPQLRAQIEGKLFVMFGDREAGGGDKSRANVLFNLGHDRARAFLDSVLELFETGSAYAIEPYSLEQALNAGEASLQVECEVGQR